ncbi:hypothetical protein [Dyella sp. 333MFSha]|uniref:hypothetical protein n=1 Tax=Dyella sp. 333MFSha TaxID=1798240 RepID=UPI00088A9C3A|nr:hypothetical protein [Dyella sp. 333MFSha]SDF40326.1 Uncharacterized protein YaaW, UPF0174 family [Dyella sp. 333MFSha]
MERMDIEGDSALLNLLAESRASDLDVLVMHLTDDGKGRLALPAAVKELLLEASQRGIYSRETLRILIGELQQFGGHSIANLARRGGVAYREIVADALSYVGGQPEGAMPVERMELEFLAARLEKVWPVIDDEQRRSLNAAGTSVGDSAGLPAWRAAILNGGAPAAAVAQWLSRTKLPDLNSPVVVAKAVGKFALGRLLSGPAALAAAANDLASAAFRVTVPCVTQIAYLRQMQPQAAAVQCDGCGATAMGQEKFCGQCGEPLARIQRVASQDDHSLFHVGVSPDAPLVSFSGFDRALLPARVQQVDLGSGLDRLSPLLQALPSQLVAGEVGAHHYLKCVVNGSLAQAADGNGLRGFVRGPDGRFVEHARFFEDDRLANLANGAALFQIVSVLVAQKHLADISRKLNEVLEGIGRIETFQQNERKSAIEAAIAYLQEVAPLILRGDLNAIVHAQLEQYESGLRATQSHLQKDIEAVIAEVATFKDPDTFGTAGLTKALRLRQERFEDLVTQWKYCLAARFMACRLVACYPESVTFAMNRRDALEQVAGGLSGAEGFLTKFSTAVDARRATFKAVTDSAVAVSANQERLRLWEQARQPLLAMSEHVSFNHLDRLALDHAEPAVVVLEVRDGQILRALAA